MPDILIVDDDPLILPVLKDYLSKKSFSVRTSESLSEARKEIADKIPDGVLIDLGLPDGSGIELVDDLKNTSSQIIIMTGTPSLESAIAGIRWNAVDYLVKPLELPRLQNWLEGLKDENHVNPEKQAVVEDHHLPTNRLIGNSLPMQRVNKLIQKVAPFDITVLLQGESGTGKELAAQSIHQFSARKHQIMLPLNCGAANEYLIGDELFGHERGGFTGANRLHKGYFERANGGTLFLDEITEMSIDLQAHLLRVLESGEFVRIGGDTVIKTDVRIIAATNQDPHEAIALGKLREDLYYRLAVFPIHLPPLRERGRDIALLAQYFVDLFNASSGYHKTIASSTLEFLQTLAWPGNIRELRNALQRAHLIAEDTIEVTDFDIYSNNFSARETKSILAQTGSSIEQVEKNMILATLEECQGNKRLASQALGISLKTLYNKLKKYQLAVDKTQPDEKLN